MREIAPIGFRPRSDVKKLLQLAARDNERSVNSQIQMYVIRGLRLDGYSVPRSPEKEDAPEAATSEASASHPNHANDRRSTP